MTKHTATNILQQISHKHLMTKHTATYISQQTSHDKHLMTKHPSAAYPTSPSMDATDPVLDLDRLDTLSADVRENTDVVLATLDCA